MSTFKIYDCGDVYYIAKSDLYAEDGKLKIEGSERGTPCVFVRSAPTAKEECEEFDPDRIYRDRTFLNSKKTMLVVDYTLNRDMKEERTYAFISSARLS